MHCLLEWASLSEVYQYHATPKCVFGSNSNFEAFSPHNLSLLFPLPFRSMISEFAVQKTQSLSKHSLLDEKERLLWDSPTQTFHFCISQTWWRIVDFLRWFSSHLWFWFFCFFVQGGDKLRYHFRDDGFRLWTALKRLILNQKRMHVFCFVFVFYPLKFVGMFMGLSGESTAQMDRLILNIIWCHCLWSNKFLLPYDQ